MNIVAKMCLECVLTPNEKKWVGAKIEKIPDEKRMSEKGERREERVPLPK